MAAHPKDNRKIPRIAKRAAARLPRICANCGRWSWKSGCRHDKNAAPSKSCGRFEMGRFASYAIDDRGKVIKIDSETYSGNETSEALAEEVTAADWVVQELRRRDIAHIDNRNKKSNTGYLWVMGGNTAVMQQLMNDLGDLGADFLFTESGDGATENRPAWRLIGYPERK